MRIKQIQLLGLFLITAGAQAQSLQQKLQSAFSRLQQDSQCRYASVSLTVLDAKTGEAVFAANPDMGLAPASTLKTVTSATAFYMLGKDFQYQTQIGYTGSINNGILNGDIIITGAGDPTLGSWRWEETKEKAELNVMVIAIKKAGIKTITGRIIGNESVFGTQSIPEGWIWQDIGNYYGAGTSGLCWRENQFDIKFRTGAIGTPIAIAATVPAMPYYHFKSELLNASAGTGDRSYGYLPIGNQTFYLRGTYAADQSKKAISLAVPDPSYDLAYRLKDTLQSVGISTSGQPESVATLMAKDASVMGLQSGITNLTIIKSPTLSKIIYWLNQKSINLYAEQLLKTLAWKAGKPVSTANGVSIVQDFWKTHGIDPEALNIVDGSGLSPGDRVTTQTLARILKTVKTETWFADYYESLPTYNGMKMKSGTINNGLSYAGYQTKNGKDLTFSIIINNYSGTTSAMRQKMFRLLDELK
jgi:D-alanyl-D-alanine carboxypeptidase/D-alanyl-D-alanine-endopeptidase (penicillin-binding protein 4)